MTRKRNDNHSTEFGIWLREQKEIDSKKGFIATNIDYLWCNYKNKKWMLIEEKRHNSPVTYPQSKLFDLLENSIKDENYKGFYLLVFENTSPIDGQIYLTRWKDHKKIELSINQLLKFLLFDWPGARSV